ncbi:MAG: L-asparaginase (L-asparagine amidohydrolase)-like protein [Ramlibacter sp.]|nr:L-asparaginase (L-asparagine amidohydrolase)-like protein [Ramlibacter sp.]
MVLGTGGTVAGTSGQPGDNIGYTAAQLGIGELLGAIDSLALVPLVTEQVAQIDSKDMDDAVWARLAQRCRHWLGRDDVQGIVITHGTDTLEETAYLLHALLAPARPVVLTCAMRPATSLSPDGPQNIVDAIAVAGWPGASGVVAVCAGVIHGPVDVRKQHTYRLDAFGSGDSGPIGYVEEGSLRLQRNWPAAQGRGEHPAMAWIASGAAWPPVEIVTSHGGSSGRMVRSLVEHGIRGLVVAGTGNGTIHHAMEAALQEAVMKGVRVVRATRCAQGRVISPAGDPFETAEGLSPVKARIALQLDLMAAAPPPRG